MNGSSGESGTSFRIDFDSDRPLDRSGDVFDLIDIEIGEDEPEIDIRNNDAQNSLNDGVEVDIVVEDDEVVSPLKFIRVPDFSEGKAQVQVNENPARGILIQMSDFRNPEHAIKDDLREKMQRVLRSGTQQSFAFVNEGKLLSNVREFQYSFLPHAEFLGVRRKILYALKANPLMIDRLKKYGIDGIDCASGNEIRMALEAGFSPDQLHFNHPIRTDRDTRLAMIQGVRSFTAQESEVGTGSVIRAIDNIKNIEAADVQVAIRVITENLNARIRLSDKFGCTPSQAVELLSLNDLYGLRKGLTMHVGSQNYDPMAYYRGIELLSEIAAKAGHVSSINLGGGFPVNYGPDDKHDIKEHLDAINQAIERFRDRLFGVGNIGEVIVEPGRKLVAEAVDEAIPIHLITDRGVGRKEIHIGDGIFTSFSDAVIHKWKYYFQLYTKDGRPVATTREPFRVWGQTCDTGDQLPEIWLPSNVRNGDFLWVRNAGAYMDAQRTNFNGFVGPNYSTYNKVEI